MHLKRAGPQAVVVNPEDKDMEIIEFELSGKIYNRIHKPKEQVKEIIKMFYETHPYNSQAYLIKQSKMNFKSLLND